MPVRMYLPCYAAGAQTGRAEDAPSGRAVDHGLDILGERAATTEPSDGSLAHPAAWQRSEPLCRPGAADDRGRGAMAENR